MPRNAEIRVKQVFVILWKISQESNLAVMGYCLMENHIHVLIKEGSENISDCMKRLRVSYILRLFCF